MNSYHQSIRGSKGSDFIAFWNSIQSYLGKKLKASVYHLICFVWWNTGLNMWHPGLGLAQLSKIFHFFVSSLFPLFNSITLIFILDFPWQLFKKFLWFLFFLILYTTIWPTSNFRLFIIICWLLWLLMDSPLSWFDFPVRNERKKGRMAYFHLYFLEFCL